MNSGTAVACLADYARQATSLESLALFCRVTPATVSEWLSGRRPKGERMFSLWVFLELHGYKVDELDRLPRPTHDLAVMLACDVLSYEYVRAQLGYTSVKMVHRLIREGTSLMPARARELEKLVKANLPALDHRSDKTGAKPDGGYDTMEEVSSAGIADDALSDVSSKAPMIAQLIRQAARRIPSVDRHELHQSLLAEMSPAEIEELAVLLLDIV